MEVTFHRFTERRLSYWEADRGKRRVVPGTTMALGRGDMPHDLKQFVVEAALPISDGFWCAIHAGATFQSTGRKRTKPGRAVIAKNRQAIDAAEHTVGLQVNRWLAGDDSPVSQALARVDQLWNEVPAEGALRLVWPTLDVVAIT